MRMFHVAAVAAILPMCASACHHTREASSIPAKPACTTSVVTIWEGAQTDCDVIVPQRLDVLIATDSADVARAKCESMGAVGDTWDVDASAFRCEGVDY